MTITLTGKPVSVNEMYRGRRFLTYAGKAIKTDYMYQAKSQYRGGVLKKELSVVLHVYFPTRNRSDLDNVLKATLDSLTGVLWVDDRQIHELHAFKHFDARKPRIEIEVEVLN